VFSSKIKKGKRIVGLDIEASSIAATELEVNGGVRLGGYGIGSLDAGIFRDGEVLDPEELAGALKELFSSVKLSRDVRLGVANQRVTVRTLRLPRMEDPAELEAAIRFQAQDQIPMPLEQAVLDWQVIPAPPTGEIQEVDVVVVAARRDMLQKAIQAVRGAGLRLVGIDHSAFALIRALKGSQNGEATTFGPVDPGVSFDPMGAGEAIDGQATTAAMEMEPIPAEPADGIAGRAFCSLGDVTNLAVSRGPYCVFTRALSFGVEGMAQSLAERAGLTLGHARQWLVHVGLEAPLEAVEGDPEVVSITREALANGASRLGDELRPSLEFYAAQEDSVRVESMVVAGAGTRIPGLIDRLRQELPVPIEAVTPGALAGIPGEEAARLTLSYGLGLEE